MREKKSEVENYKKFENDLPSEGFQDYLAFQILRKAQKYILSLFIIFASILGLWGINIFNNNQDIKERINNLKETERYLKNVENELKEKIVNLEKITQNYESQVDSFRGNISSLLTKNEIQKKDLEFVKQEIIKGWVKGQYALFAELGKMADSTNKYSRLLNDQNHKLNRHGEDIKKISKTSTQQIGDLRDKTIYSKPFILEENKEARAVIIDDKTYRFSCSEIKSKSGFLSLGGAQIINLTVKNKRNRTIKHWEKLSKGDKVVFYDEEIDTKYILYIEEFIKGDNDNEEMMQITIKKDRSQSIPKSILESTKNAP